MTLGLCGTISVRNLATYPGFSFPGLRNEEWLRLDGTWLSLLLILRTETKGEMSCGSSLGNSDYTCNHQMYYWFRLLRNLVTSIYATFNQSYIPNQLEILTFVFQDYFLSRPHKRQLDTYKTPKAKAGVASSVVSRAGSTKFSISHHRSLYQIISALLLLQLSYAQK